MSSPDRSVAGSVVRVNPFVVGGVRPYRRARAGLISEAPPVKSELSVRSPRNNTSPNVSAGSSAASFATADVHIGKSLGFFAIVRTSSS